VLCTSTIPLNALCWLHRLKQGDVELVLDMVAHLLRDHPLVDIRGLQQSGQRRAYPVHGHDVLEQNPNRHQMDRAAPHVKQHVSVKQAEITRFA
jgi:hypothetical protein